MNIKKPLHYGDVVEYNSTIFSCIDTVFEDGIRKAILEWANGNEEERGDHPKIVVVPVAEVELVKDREIITRARTRTRSVTK